MELNEFLAETLVEIQQGVQQAIQCCAELKINGVINPVRGTTQDVGRSHNKESSLISLSRLATRQPGKLKAESK
jgi:hypothetical protein